MDTIAVMIDDLLVAIPIDAWEASLAVEKSRRTAFILAQLHRAPEPCAAPARSLVRPVER
jgi:hypothetical protein